MMRTTILVLNSVVVIFFALFLAYTLFARQHLGNLARGYVTQKTLEYSGPIVDLAEDSLESRLVKMLLSKEQITAIRRQIADYRNDPAAYVSDLTRRQKVQDLPAQNGNPLLASVAAIKEKIRTFYDDTLNALIRDLRIFSLSNLIAALIAWVLAFRSRAQIRQSIIWFSFLMLLTVIYCSYLYVDGLTFFRILFRTHMGWWYPMFLSVMLIVLYLDYLRGINSNDQVDEVSSE